MADKNYGESNTFWGMPVASKPLSYSFIDNNTLNAYARSNPDSEAQAKFAARYQQMCDDPAPMYHPHHIQTEFGLNKAELIDRRVKPFGIATLASILPTMIIGFFVAPLPDNNKMWLFISAGINIGLAFATSYALKKSYDVNYQHYTDQEIGKKLEPKY